MSLVWITKAEYMGGSTLLLTFNDGKSGTADLSGYAERYPLFSPLRDPEVFSRFTLDGWTVSWLDGKIDIAPETLYDITN